MLTSTQKHAQLFLTRKNSKRSGVKGLLSKINGLDLLGFYKKLTGTRLALKLGGVAGLYNIVSLNDVVP